MNRNAKIFRATGTSAAFFLFLSVLYAAGLGIQRRPDGIPSYQWIVPLYALGKDGAPVTGLKAEDLSLEINGVPIEFFELIKATTTGPGLLASRQKIIFLVFDGALSPPKLLSQAKRIAEAAIRDFRGPARYVIMSIEPFAGLRYIWGPTSDVKTAIEKISKHVAGKKAGNISLRPSDIDSSGIREIYPEWTQRYEGAAGSFGQTLKGRAEKMDSLDMKRTSGVFLSALMTLNLILDYSRSSAKVVYLFSCGIPRSALEDKTELPYESGAVASFSPDNLDLDRLKAIGASFNRNGALMCAVNPSGTRIATSNLDSGEESLKLLAHESGGRYFEGAVADVVKMLAEMEGAYYEIAFSDRGGNRAGDLEFGLKAKPAGLTVYSLKRLSRGKEYREMDPFEKEMLVINILRPSLFSQTKLRLMPVEGEITREKDTLLWNIPIPFELALSEWDVFKVWRNASSGKVELERNETATSSQVLKLVMKWKKGCFHEIVLVHEKTSVALVCRTSEEKWRRLLGQEKR